MKTFKSKMMIAVLISLIGIISITSVVLAASSSKTGTVNGKAVKAEKVINLGQQSWSAQIWSYSNANPQQNIGTLGWDWWTTRELCNGTINHQDTHDGTGTQYNTTSAETYYYSSWYNPSCNNKHKVAELGKHDIKDGSDSWYPEFTLTVAVP
jgi:hypothetical protein